MAGSSYSQFLDKIHQNNSIVESLETQQQLLPFIQQLLFLDTFHILSKTAFKARIISFILQLKKIC